MLLNLARARAFMRQAGLDALVATSPVNITYFTDYFSWTDTLFKEYMMSPGASAQLAQSYAVLPYDDEPALIIGPLMAINAHDIWVRDLQFVGDGGLDFSLQPEAIPEAGRALYEKLHAPPANATATEALLNLLRARGLAGARLGIEMEGLTPKARAELDGALPEAHVRDCTNLIRLVRAVKSEEELRRMTYAAEVSERVGLESLALARPGVKARDLVEHYRAGVSAQGADFDHFAYGTWGMGIDMESDYVFAEGDIQYVDWGCLYKRYFSDTGTTLVVGALPEVLERRHAALRACVAAAIEVGKPGVNVSKLEAAMRETLKDRGITRTFPHGHGFGLEIRDYPILVKDNGLRIHDDCVDVASDLPLEVDMVFNLEAAIFMPAVGSLHIEKSFRVTPEGCAPLVPQDRSAPFQAGGAGTN